MRAWTLLVIKTRQLLSERESQSAMIICRVCARRFFQFPVMFTNNRKWRLTSWLTMFNSLFSFPTFLLFSPFRLVMSNTWVQWKHLTKERSIDLCLQTFPKLLLLLIPKVTTRSLYPDCIANLKLPIDAFYGESRSGVNIAKRNITTGLFGLGYNWIYMLPQCITGQFWKTEVAVLSDQVRLVACRNFDIFGWLSVIYSLKVDQLKQQK